MVKYKNVFICAGIAALGPMIGWIIEEIIYPTCSLSDPTCNRVFATLGETLAATWIIVWGIAAVYCMLKAEEGKDRNG